MRVYAFDLMPIHCI